SKRMVDVPAITVGQISALRMVGRRDEAYRAATTLVKRNPGSCEANAVLASLKAERGQAAASRQLVRSALRAGAAAEVGPSALRCAVMSAAAVGDGLQVGALLRRTAADEQLLRRWALVEISGMSGSRLLRRAVFPWTRVEAQPAFAEAREA